MRKLNQEELSQRRYEEHLGKSAFRAGKHIGFAIGFTTAMLVYALWEAFK